MARCLASWTWTLSLTPPGWQAVHQVVLCGTSRESQPLSHAPAPGGAPPEKKLCPMELGQVSPAQEHVYNPLPYEAEIYRRKFSGCRWG